jgi:hypothetical protein
MGIEAFSSTTWRVLNRPGISGEIAGHVLRIEENGFLNVTINCTGNPPHAVRQGWSDPNSDCIEGDDFTITFESTTPAQIVCAPKGDISSTGSWTAEDTSGMGND